MVDAGDDEEYPRALNIEMSKIISVFEGHLCPALLEPAQPEDDGPLVLLHHLPHLTSLQHQAKFLICIRNSTLLMVDFVKQLINYLINFIYMHTYNLDVSLRRSWSFLSVLD